ncbi:MAG TPA: RNA polymerase sigma-70 factor [Balneolaceae bacterium]
MNKSTEIFETYRPGLFRLAYAMLKRVAPAEDAVQEAFLRWRKQDIEQIHSNQAYLSRIVSNICLDEIKSARNRREQYIGPDLPEPLLAAGSETPEAKAELAESLSMALLVVLEQLNPVQRAVFILREVFDYDYSSVAEIINKSESHCRKIAQRARESVQKKKPRFEKNTAEQRELVTTFIKAMQDGELTEVEGMLAEEAILYSDGGGKVAAVRKPVAGATKIAKFLTGIQKGVTQALRVEFTDINGEPGMITYLDEQLNNVWSFHIEDDKIQSIYVVLNPDKLEYLKHEL